MGAASVTTAFPACENSGPENRATGNETVFLLFISRTNVEWKSPRSGDRPSTTAKSPRALKVPTGSFRSSMSAEKTQAVYAPPTASVIAAAIQRNFDISRWLRLTSARPRDICHAPAPVRLTTAAAISVTATILANSMAIACTSGATIIHTAPPASAIAIRSIAAKPDLDRVMVLTTWATRNTITTAAAVNPTISKGLALNPRYQVRLPARKDG